MRMNGVLIRVTGTLLLLGMSRPSALAAPETLDTIAIAAPETLDTIAIAAPDAAEKQAGAENQNVAPSASVSVLQVTGTTNVFTISAQHADVLSLLKLVFDQAHRQFVPDAGVSGDVTFALSGQRFDTVLASICRQTFLRYEVDKQGIYQFRRDEESLRDLLLKTQAINNVLSEQLRRMGYAVPSAPFGANELSRGRALSSGQAAPGAAANSGMGAGQRGEFGGGGGFGRNNAGYAGGQGSRNAASNSPVLPPGSADTTAGRRNADIGKDEQSGSANSKVQARRKPDDQGSLEGSQKPSPVNGASSEPGQAGPAGQAAAPGTNRQAAGVSQDGQASVRDIAPSDLEFANTGQYQTFMKQNHLVAINTRGEKVPVLQVLADLSRQANVPILVDPDVPKGKEFVVSAAIPACPLNVMLNYLGYGLRLEWRWVNSRIYITTTPEIQPYLHGVPLPAPANGNNIGSGITILPQRSTAPQNQAPQKRSEDAEKSKEDKKDGKGAGG